MILWPTAHKAVASSRLLLFGEEEVGLVVLQQLLRTPWLASAKSGLRRACTDLSLSLRRRRKGDAATFR